jgi:hypothetical protein
MTRPSHSHKRERGRPKQSRSRNRKHGTEPKRKPSRLHKRKRGKETDDELDYLTYLLEEHQKENLLNYVDRERYRMFRERRRLERKRAKSGGIAYVV